MTFPKQQTSLLTCQLRHLLTFNEVTGESSKHTDILGINKKQNYTKHFYLTWKL